jgi:acyl-CoA thioester hydrolase
MSVNWDYPQPYWFVAKVNAEHIDALGHTNNAVYTSWCEQVAWQHSAALGLDAGDYKRLQRAMAIQEAHYQYLAPSFEGDAVIVGTWLTACNGRLSMERCFQINNQSSGQCLFRGRWQLVCINLLTNKPTRMPEEFKQAYIPQVVAATM